MGNITAPVVTKKVIYRGDTKTYNFVLKRAGVPIVLTGYSIYFTGCSDIDDPTTTRLFSRTCSITTASEGTCQVTLSSADTDTLCTNGVAEVSLVDSGGNEDTLGQWYIDIVQDARV